MTAVEGKKRGPLASYGGIRAKTEFDDTHWWTREWVAHIEKLSGRQKLIPSAKSCVRAGSVLDVNINAGAIDAKVQGRRKAPYQVRLYCDLPTDEQAARLKDRLARKAATSAALLSGEMPLDVKEGFDREGFALLPGGFARQHRLCSCPAQTSVCKHILAVLFVVADVIDRDPLALLKLRGLDRDSLLSCLLGPRNGTADPEPQQRPCPAAIHTEEDEGDAAEGDDAPLDASSFYGASGLTGDLTELWDSLRECAGAPLPDPRAPIQSFPFWKGDTTFSDSIEPYYDNVRKALRGKS
ncbi:MAG: hypothetical protein LBF92_07735 [Synergistaceae bacterium]|jgi:uncharacterized Zn finger protein|nr:hypothetical protein [Synergistaceae bacterium]